MKLRLADGWVAEGRSFGAARDAFGEVVFHTGLTGYVEALTDPSYRGQILALTYPLQGNYGVPVGPFESSRIQVQGLIVSRYSAQSSHHASSRTLGEWLRAEGVPGVEGVDTRRLTRHLREHGTIDGCLISSVGGAPCIAERIDMARVVELVTPREVIRYSGGDLRILVIDTGAKESIVRSLQLRGATVIRVPCFFGWEPLLDDVDGVVLTNGPGDPTNLPEVVERIRGVLARGVPTFGICLGHQLLALAAGAKTEKLAYGHRSHNQPVIERASRKAYVTSQNHGYAVRDETIPRDWETWFTNLNDGTNEGLRHGYGPFRSVQFHPEASAGPHDTAFLFDEFVRMATQLRKAKQHEWRSSALLAATT